MEPITGASPLIVAIAVATWYHDNRYTMKALHISKIFKKKKKISLKTIVL